MQLLRDNLTVGGRFISAARRGKWSNLGLVRHILSLCDKFTIITKGLGYIYSGTSE